MVKTIFGILSTFLLTLLPVTAQQIELYNPSFEGPPHQGNAFSRIIGWNDCGMQGETPPDIHGNGTHFFNVTQTPLNGSSFLGMVVRETDTWESVSQRLNTPLRANQCYAFSISLSRSEHYLSGIKTRRDAQIPFTKPIVLRIYGSNKSCTQNNSEKELLSESEAVRNTIWKRYDFKFKPKKNYRYLILEAYYKSPTLFAYNGNILLDNASPIIPIQCDEDPQAVLDQFEEQQAQDLNELLALLSERSKSTGDKQKTKEKSINQKAIQNTNKKDKTPAETAQKEIDRAPVDAIEKVKKTKSIVRNKTFKIEELNKPLAQNQIIRLKNFYFDADTSTLKAESLPQLDELFFFLRDNPQIIIEIGGHTNSLPKDPAYCDRLSLARAKAVRQYLIQKGIEPKRLLFKGYGKRHPITTDNSPEAQRKNQRVEIKIISLG